MDRMGHDLGLPGAGDFSGAREELCTERWAALETSGMQGLEEQHANLLSDDFEPNVD